MTHARTIEAATPPPPTGATNARRATDGQARRAALASFLGSALEYYDFFIYGTAAALVFPKVFFAASDPATATLLSLATFGVAYVARPSARSSSATSATGWAARRCWSLTLLLMGVSTFLIGCLPDLRRGRRAGARPAGGVPLSCRASRRPASRPAPTP